MLCNSGTVDDVMFAHNVTLQAIKRKSNKQKVTHQGTARI